AKLPDITDFARTYLGVEPKTELIPIQPTAHYAMGGIPTNIDAQVLRDEAGHVIPGLYSAGESACVSVHGANRLGTNSLVDLVVFGRRAGNHMLQENEESELPPLPNDPDAVARAQVDALLTSTGGEHVAELRSAMQEFMMDKVSVVRDNDGLMEAKRELGEVRRAYRHISLDDKGKVFNTDLLEAFELGCMIDCAEATIEGALARTESRGAHYREDYQARDDANWLAHTMVYKGSGGLEMRKKPVVITEFQPKERKY
ncbi:MAG: FAD-binding protein, partial [Chloroflexota bacterium]